MQMFELTEQIENMTFQRIEGNSPEFVCNVCNSPFSSKGYISEITINDEGDTFSNTVCSTVCRDRFLTNPQRFEHILASIAVIKYSGNFQT